MSTSMAGAGASSTREERAAAAAARVIAEAERKFAAREHRRRQKASAQRTQEKEYPALLSAGGGGRGVGTTMSSRDLRAVHIQELTLVKKKNTRIPETLNDGRVGCGAVCSTALGTSWGLGGRGGSRSHTGRLYLRTYDRILNSARSLVEEEFPAPDEGGWVQCEHHDEQHQGPGAPRACRRVATTENILKKNTLLGPALVVVVDGWASCMWCKHSAGQLAGTWGSAAIVGALDVWENTRDGVRVDADNSY
eukprot:1187313-Prorocentrum_minimum.AAC.2